MVAPNAKEIRETKFPTAEHRSRAFEPVHAGRGYQKFFSSSGPWKTEKARTSEKLFPKENNPPVREFATGTLVEFTQLFGGSVVPCTVIGRADESLYGANWYRLRLEDGGGEQQMRGERLRLAGEPVGSLLKFFSDKSSGGTKVDQHGRPFAILGGRRPTAEVACQTEFSAGFATPAMIVQAATLFAPLVADVSETLTLEVVTEDVVVDARTHVEEDHRKDTPILGTGHKRSSACYEADPAPKRAKIADASDRRLAAKEPPNDPPRQTTSDGSTQTYSPLVDLALNALQTVHGGAKGFEAVPEGFRTTYHEGALGLCRQMRTALGKIRRFQRTVREDEEFHCTVCYSTQKPHPSTSPERLLRVDVDAFSPPTPNYGPPNTISGASRTYLIVCLMSDSVFCKLG